MNRTYVRYLTLLSLIASLIVIPLLSIPAFADNVTLKWDPNSEADLAGYRVYYGITSRIYTARIDVGKVTTYTVTSLVPRIYYFTVTAYNSSGIESAYSDEVSNANERTAPLISSIAASSITANTAVISWLTDRASDSQVEYGITIPSGTMTTVDPALVTLHSQKLTGLAANTLYQYRVRSKDAAGNSAVSAVFSFTTPPAADTTPPTISAISASVTATGAVVSWLTNEPATSQVEYGPMASYGSSTTLEVGLVTNHSQSLSGLTADTSYHYRVKSRDSAGNLGVSADLTFKTTTASGQIKLSLYFPAISPLPASRMIPGSEEYTGIALSNLDSQPANVRFTAYEASGTKISGAGITNPAERILSPGEQMPVIDAQLFGAKIYNSGTTGFIRVDSSTEKLAGFFMAFDSSLSLLDGAEISPALSRSFVLPEVSSQELTKILLANPNKETAAVTIELMKFDGTVRSTAQRSISGTAALSSDIASELFAGFYPQSSDYIRVSSNQALLAFESLARSQKDVAILAAQDRGNGATALYSPQYAVGGQWRTALSIINLDPSAGAVSLKLIGDDGIQIGSTRIASIAGYGKLYISDQGFFDNSILIMPDRLMQGYVVISADNLHLTGSVVFGDAKQGIFSSALPLVSTIQKSVIFSHIASNGTYFTGLAILNPNNSNLTATIGLYDSAGRLQGSITQAIAAMQRKSRLLTEYFPALVGQNRTSGYIRVTAGQGAACFALFGTNNLSVLSAIPAQAAP